MEAGLRAAGDRDLASIGQTVRAQHHLVRALAITQSQHTEVLAAHGEAIEAIRRDHGAKLDEIITLLNQLIDENGRSE